MSTPVDSIMYNFWDGVPGSDAGPWVGNVTGRNFVNFCQWAVENDDVYRDSVFSVAPTDALFDNATAVTEIQAHLGAL